MEYIWKLQESGGHKKACTEITFKQMHNLWINLYSVFWKQHSLVGMQTGSHQLSPSHGLMCAKGPSQELPQSSPSLRSASKDDFSEDAVRSMTSRANVINSGSSSRTLKHPRDACSCVSSVRTNSGALKEVFFLFLIKKGRLPGLHSKLSQLTSLKSQLSSPLRNFVMRLQIYWFGKFSQFLLALKSPAS